MTWFRHRLGLIAALLAMGAARITHLLVHLTIWLRDEEDEYECEDCNNNEPTDGPWAI